MKCSRELFYCFAVIVLLAANANSEIKVTPVASVDLLGGQYWITGAAPDQLSLNADVFYSPVMNFSPRTALLPIYTGLYSSTKDVRELVGGGTLTREIQDHSVSFKLVHKISENLKVKGRIGYKMELLKETVDETWGKGLFDFNKLIIGAEGEKKWSEWNGRAGIDYYTMKYPNYESLVSQSAFESSVDTGTYKEISAQAGKNTLDYSTISIFAEATRKFGANMYGTAHNDLSFKSFSDQKVINNTGEFTADKRADMVDYLTLGFKVVGPRATFSLTDGIQYYKSNQNSYDAVNNIYTANYYNYIQNSVIPGLSFNLGSVESPVSLSLYWDITYRQYYERLAQTEEGVNKTDKTVQVTNTMGVSMAYPLAKSLKAKLSTNYRDASSNMKYEKTYKYNYYTFNYFLGVNWQL